MDFERNRELHQLRFLYLLLSKLSEIAPNYVFSKRDTNSKEAYVKKAISYITMKYPNNLSILQIAQYIGIDRSYFCSIFKECIKASPQQFIENFRINRACELLLNKNLSIGDVSRSVGYHDPLHFSKVLKKIKGLSPREYRNLNRC